MEYSRKTPVYHAPKPIKAKEKHPWWSQHLLLLEGLRCIIDLLAHSLRFVFITLEKLFLRLQYPRIAHLCTLASAGLGSLILPAQHRHSSLLNSAELRAMALTRKQGSEKGWKITESIVITHDQAALDTLEIRPPQQTQEPLETRSYVIKFCGNSGRYEKSTALMLDISADLNTHMIGFNYRGVGCSTGQATQFDDWVTDGIAQVERILDRHKDCLHYPTIYLDGISLGAAIATQVAQYFHAQGVKVFLHNDRSFSTLTNAATGIVLTAFERRGWPKLGLVCAYLLWPIVKVALVVTRWEVNPAASYVALPDTHKQYTVVRSPKRCRKTYADDQIIHYEWASLHRSRPMIAYRKRRMRKLIRRLDLAKKAFQAFRKDIHSHKMQLLHAPEKDAHAQPIARLKNRQGQQGDFLVKKFYEQAQQQHQKDIGDHH